MNYLQLRDPLSQALANIEVTLQNSIVSAEEKGWKGSGQLIQPDGKAEHVGIYGTSAVFESIDINNNDFDSYLLIFEQLASPRDNHFKRNSKVIFKLAAAINGLKAIHSQHRTEKSEKILAKLANNLLEMRRETPNGEIYYWPFSESSPEPIIKPTSFRKWVLPSAYALGALSGTHATQDDLDGVVKLLSSALEKHLSSEEVLHSYELVHVLLALNSVPQLRSKYLPKKEIEKAEYSLYVHFVGSDEYKEKFINFVTFYPVFSSLFYVIKTDLTIVKYFLLTDSKYVHSRDVLMKIHSLINSVKQNGAYISQTNDQISVRANALVCRVLKLLSDGLAKIEPRYKTVFGASFINKYIRWSPNANVTVLLKRLLALLFISSPIIYIIYSSIDKGRFIDNGLPLLASISASVVAAVIYERLRRR